MAVTMSAQRAGHPLRLVLALVGGMGLFAGVLWLGDEAFMPVTTIRITGDAPHVDVERLKLRLASAVDGNFLTLDVRRVSRAAEALPWVAGASVRRVWPDTLEVTLRERVPLARWGLDALMDETGAVFRPDRLPQLPGLPRLDGPPGSEAEVLGQYRQLEPRLSGIGLHLEALALSPRRAWSARLAGGIRLALGRGDPGPLIDRLAVVYPRVLAREAARIEQIDLRYPNGLAVRWKDGKTEQHG